MAKNYWNSYFANPNLKYGVADNSRIKCYECGVYPATPYDEDFLCHKCRDKKNKIKEDNHGARSSQSIQGVG